MILARVHDTVLCIKSSSMGEPKAWIMKGQTYVVTGHMSAMGRYYYKLRDKPFLYGVHMFTSLLTHKLPEDLFTL